MRYICPLCKEDKISRYFSDEFKSFGSLKRVEYFLCHTCDLVFQDPETWLPEIQEKQRYEEHNNCLEDENYLSYLNKSLQFVVENSKSAIQSAVDYGCGPVEGLKEIATDMDVTSYDPYFFSDIKLIESAYDAVFCIEAIEHFNNPQEELIRICKLIAPKGYLFIRTGVRKDLKHFEKWYYHRDPTHICFYSENTMLWISKYFNLWMIKVSGDYVLFMKN